MIGFGKMKWIGVSMALILFLPLLAGCALSAKQDAAAAVKPTPEQLQKVKLLNETAETMYQKVQQGDIPGSRAVLQQISDQVTQIRFEGITSVEGLNALTDTITEAKRVFQAVKFNPDAGKISAAKVRLATDSLTHASQPLWLQYYKQLQDDVNVIEQTAKASDKTSLQHASAHIEQHYSIIHPSLLISRPAEDVERMDSLVAFVKSQSMSQGMPFRNVLNAVPPMRQMLDKLFMKREATAYLPYPEPQNPILWTLAFGSVILAALGFAGWRLSKKNDGIVTVRRNEDGYI